jgi:hypothetical protein
MTIETEQAFIDLKTELGKPKTDWARSSFLDFILKKLNKAFVKIKIY